ncbi:MAG TPA: LD-carboxypeptidase [Bacteroidota bacterium]|nr:LD-carboxypeptidase [Bacteroidota bacterium]
MKRIRPPALRKGDVIGICAPASPPFRRDDLMKGIAYLEGLGYRVQPGRNLYKKDGYLAGTDRERASDLNRLFSDRRVRAIVALRGGYGSMRILPMIDYAAVRKDPKIFVGYSDLTAVQMALWAMCGLVTFAGPMVAAGMARGLKGEAEEIFWRMLTSRRPFGRLRTPAEVMRRGTASGALLGGNLSMISHLAGTAYLPRAGNGVFFFEDVGERPYRIDRMLQHLRLSGMLDGVRGVILGRFADCVPEPGKPSLSLRRIFDDAFRDPGAPVVSGIRHGHIAGSLTLPVGLRVTLEAGNDCRIVFPGSAVV